MNFSILGLDVGSVRIGVSLGDTATKIPYPLTTLAVDGTEHDNLELIIRDHDIKKIVIGYPRNQLGEPTAQTKYVEKFVQTIKDLNVEIVYQDESLTSVTAEEYLTASRKPYTKADIDARAAAIILEDYLNAYDQ